MGILSFGLSAPRTLALNCGFTVTFWGLVQIVVYMGFPAYFIIESICEGVVGRNGAKVGVM
eukprot:gene31006-38320_t